MLCWRFRGGVGCGVVAVGRYSVRAVMWCGADGCGGGSGCGSGGMQFWRYGCERSLAACLETSNTSATFAIND